MELRWTLFKLKPFHIMISWWQQRSSQKNIISTYPAASVHPIWIVNIPEPRLTSGRVLKISDFLVIFSRRGRQECPRIEMCIICIKCILGKLLCERPDILLEMIKYTFKSIREIWNQWEWPLMTILMTGQTWTRCLFWVIVTKFIKSVS